MLNIIGEELSLLGRNIRGRLGYRAEGTQSYFIIKDILPPSTFSKIKDVLVIQKNNSLRQESFFRKGSAFDATDMRNNCPEVVCAVVSESLLLSVRQNTGIESIQFVPGGDVNQISLLHYRNAGDGIDWHVDGNIYIGQRWAGILTISEETEDPDSKLEILPKGKRTTFPVESVENSLILFQGDQVRHRVREMRDGEERLVINLLFTTNPKQSRNPFMRGYQSLVNYFFYGRLRSGFQIQNSQQEDKT
ncbi:MAG: hypothetical protein CMK59_13275 [Proteobacteria bacterium]|nr:hypothetical protein [Pseudomonadota bacterium]